MTPSRPLILSLGSSLGDRALLLRRALDLIGRRYSVVRLSSVWESEPLDSEPDAPAYLNMIAVLRSAAVSEQVLRDCEQIERSLGRFRREKNAPRTIDIDMILAGSEIRSRGGLILPHPRYRQRNFVLLPLQEVDVGWCDPATGQPIRSMKGRGELVKVGSLSDCQRR